MIRSALLAVALLALTTTWTAPGAAGERASKSLERDLPKAHREAVRERSGSGSGSGWFNSDPDDRDSDSDSHGGHLRGNDDDDHPVAALLGAILFGSGGGSDDEPAVRHHSGGSTAEVRESRGLFYDEDAVRASGAGVDHPWLGEHEDIGLMSRINLGVALYDDRNIHESASYEYQLHARVLGTWGMGVTLGGAYGTTAATGSIARGDLETGLVLVSTNVDIPLGGGRHDPILSLGGGIGGYYADPDVDSDIREDLKATGLRLDQGHYWFLDKRVRADILIPIDRERHGFLGFGVVRDWADGTVTTTMRDTTTGAAVSKDSAHMDFDRTTFQLSLVIIF